MGKLVDMNSSEPSQTIYISVAEAPAWVRYCFRTAEAIRGTEREYMTPLFEQLGRFTAKAIAKNWKFNGVRHDGLTCDYWLLPTSTRAMFRAEFDIYAGYPKRRMAA